MIMIIFLFVGIWWLVVKTLLVAYIFILSFICANSTHRIFYFSQQINFTFLSCMRTCYRFTIYFFRTFLRLRFYFSFSIALIALSLVASTSLKDLSSFKNLLNYQAYFHINKFLSNKLLPGQEPKSDHYFFGRTEKTFSSFWSPLHPLSINESSHIHCLRTLSMSPRRQRIATRKLHYFGKSSWLFF